MSGLPGFWQVPSKETSTESQFAPASSIFSPYTWRVEVRPSRVARTGGYFRELWIEMGFTFYLLTARSPLL